MCGRYTLYASPYDIKIDFDLELTEEIGQRFNCAPGQILPVISSDDPLHLSFYKWGLIPSWANDPSIANKLINARRETLKEKPSFRSALKKRRCLIPSNGFFEWKKEEGAKNKTPYFISFGEDSLVSFAGLWEEWLDEAGSMVRTFAIITTEANKKLQSLHERMPVIIEKEMRKKWLDITVPAEDVLLSNRQPNEQEIHTIMVSTAVNNVRNDSPELLSPTPTLFP